MKFRRRPVIVEAIQWMKVGDHPNVIHYTHADFPESLCPECGRTMIDHGYIDNVDTAHMVHVGDWLIQGVKGPYPCRPEMFNEKYDLVLA